MHSSSTYSCPPGTVTRTFGNCHVIYSPRNIAFKNLRSIQMYDVFFQLPCRSIKHSIYSDITGASRCQVMGIRLFVQQFVYSQANIKQYTDAPQHWSFVGDLIESIVSLSQRVIYMVDSPRWCYDLGVESINNFGICQAFRSIAY